MKIGLVSPYDYASPGGVVVHISNLIRHFMIMGHKVKVLASCSKKGVSYFGEEVICIGKPFPIPSAGSIARVALSPWLPAQVRKVLSEEKFDILHIHEPFGSVLSLWALIESNTINVGTFHAYHTKPRGYWLGKSILRRLLPKLQAKIAVSKSALKFISRHLPGDYQIIPNGVDIERFCPEGPVVDGFADGKLNILFTGRLEKRKGLDYLLGTYGKVKERFTDVRLIVVGPGTRLRRRYEKMVRDNGLTDVVFIGFVPGIDLPKYYRTAHIFCSPATGGESFGITLLEAMASGKPVVASNIEGYANVVSHKEDGLLVSPKDEEAIAEALLSLLIDESLRYEMGLKGRVKAEQYSWANIALKVMDCYTNLLGGLSLKKSL